MKSKSLPSAYSGSAPYIFVSYAHKDSDRVFPFISALQRHYNVWFDDGIRFGKEWEEEIADKLAGCLVFFFMVTENSLESMHCKNELNFARSENKMFVNILIDKSLQLPNWFKLGYERFQDCQLFNYDTNEDAIADMSRKISELKATTISDGGSQAPQASASGVGLSDKARKSVAVEQPKYNVGEYITFGSYKQGKSGDKETIEWLILERKGDYALLISKYIIDWHEFNTNNRGVTWETCSLRRWLNAEFLKSAFSPEEKKLILRTKTGDKVFLLNIEEAERYFESASTRACKSTEYVYPRNKTNIWCLRSSGRDDFNVAVVLSDGDVFSRGLTVIGDYGVRPALWINLKSFESF